MLTHYSNSLLKNKKTASFGRYGKLEKFPHILFFPEIKKAVPSLSFFKLKKAPLKININQNRSVNTVQHSVLTKIYLWTYKNACSHFAVDSKTLRV